MTEPELFTGKEAAALLRVDPKTLKRWAAAGKLTEVRTPGGHTRYYSADIRALIKRHPDGLPE